MWSHIKRLLGASLLVVPLGFIVIAPYNMASSSDESDYESSLASLDTSGESESSSGNNYSSSEESESECDARSWCRVPLVEDRMPPPPPRFPFQENSGISIDSDISTMNTLDFFRLFIDARIVDIVVKETNRFAEQTRPDDSMWKPVTEAELFIFFSMNMLSGIVKMPEQEINWSKDELLERPIFRKLMSLKRFNKIKQYLHFTNN